MVENIPGAAPLDGVRVLDLTRVVAGPFCTQMLADYGADVIKVEPPGGDLTRRSYGPPFPDGSAPQYWSLNRNKRGIGLDLGRAEGRQLLREMLASCDVLVHNFKPGAMERWQLAYRDLKDSFPKLIMVEISGYGATGPLGGKGGFDGTVAARAGLMATNGDERGPLRYGVPIADYSAAFHAVIGILAALLERQRSGLGQNIDISLYDCSLPLVQPHAPNWLQSKFKTGRVGNAHPTMSPFGVYRTGQGVMYLGVSTEKAFASLCRAIGAEALLADPRFADNALRMRHEAELRAALEKIFARYNAEELANLLDAADVPAGPVLEPSEALEHPHTAHRGMVAEVQGQKAVGIPIKFSRTPGALRRRAPRFGEHTREVLEELGIDAGRFPPDIFPPPPPDFG